MSPAEQNRIVKEQIVGLLPSLRAFARSLTGDPTRADDLVQEALLRALSNLDKFDFGSNLTAWMFTILRNTFYSDARKRKREVEDVDGVHAARLSCVDNQLDNLAFKDLQRAMGQLSDEQREAIVLIGASGFSYEEAATICGCAVGTMKSRVNRARTRLVQLLRDDRAEDETPADRAGENAIAPDGAYESKGPLVSAAGRAA